MTDAPAYKPQAPFKPLVVIALILTAVFALSAIGVLGAYAPEMKRGDDGRAHALSKSAIGYGGLVSLLQNMDRRVVLSRTGGRSLSGDSLLILTPSPEPDRRALDTLSQHAGVVLLVLPKWQGAPSMTHSGWIGQPFAIAPKDSLTALPLDMIDGVTVNEGQTSGPTTLFWHDGSATAALDITTLRTLAGETWIPLLADGSGHPVFAQDKATGLYVLADPDLLNTENLNDPAKARLALEIVDELIAADQAVVFDVSLNGFGRPRSVMRLLLEPPLLSFTLCLVFAVVLVGWQAAIRFAPHLHARRAVALGKKGLADNTATLVRLAGREKAMATPYAELVRGQAAKAVAAPPSLSPEALTALLDRLAARQGVEVPYARLAEDAADAKTASDLMTVARALNRWKSEMTRGRG
ncbi:MAG: hypothetical protein EON90_11185 [Brevundimonas sp.]|nr:MAG: hypothetical protein EON90_11185 [Brevundimonas sp.]